MSCKLVGTKHPIYKLRLVGVCDPWQGGGPVFSVTPSYQSAECHHILSSLICYPAHVSLRGSTAHFGYYCTPNTSKINNPKSFQQYLYYTKNNNKYLIIKITFGYRLNNNTCQNSKCYVDTNRSGRLTLGRIVQYHAVRNWRYTFYHVRASQSCNWA
jgi:hypothetical protein